MHRWLAIAAVLVASPGCFDPQPQDPPDVAAPEAEASEPQPDADISQPEPDADISQPEPAADVAEAEPDADVAEPAPESEVAEPADAETEAQPPQDADGGPELPPQPLTCGGVDLPSDLTCAGPPSPGQVGATVVHDMNGDGCQDLLLSDHTAGRLYIVYGDDTRSLSCVREVATAGGGEEWGLSTLRPADYDGDGAVDLVAIGQRNLPEPADEEAWLVQMVGAPGGNLGPASGFKVDSTIPGVSVGGTPAANNHLIVGQLDGPETPLDVMIYAAYFTMDVRILWDSFSVLGAFMNIGPNGVLGDPFGNAAGGYALGDPAEGFQDVLLVTQTKLRWLKNTDGVFALEPQPDVMQEALFPRQQGAFDLNRLRDFDGDGVPDLFGLRSGGVVRVRTLPGPPFEGTTLADWALYEMDIDVDWVLEHMALVEMDGDLSGPELAVGANPATGQVVVYKNLQILLDTLVNSGQTTGPGFGDFPLIPWRGLKSADLDGDGLYELLLVTAAGALRCVSMNGAAAGILGECE